MHIYTFLAARSGALLLTGLLVCLTACSKGNSNRATDPAAACSDSPGVLCTWAGSGEAGFNGDGRPLLDSSLYWPIDLTITPQGTAYIVDWNNHRIRRVTQDGQLATAIGTDFVGDGPYDESDQDAPGVLGTEVHLNHPTHLLPLADGTLLLTSWHNHKLRLYDSSSGLVQIICGAEPGFAGDGGPARQARLSQPPQTALGPDGSLYVLDQRNQRIRRIDPERIITTAAGRGEAGFSGDGGPPLQAQFNWPAGNNPPPAGSLVFGPDGCLYIADGLNHRIRRIDFDLDRIDTVAGNGQAGFAGDGGPPLQASLHNPRDLVFGPDGRLYIADELNHRIRRIDFDLDRIDTVAGNGQAGFAGDGGPAPLARLNRPAGLEFDANGLLYIADTYNHRIRRLAPQ
ncbi:MAG: hypothetical protein GKR89_16595 [Candidatus Latescibacteria bacterium]|nr:hypothetical protein [Candidatus Latescibacterota bacterium]